MNSYRFWGIALLYIGAGILLGAAMFFLQQSHDGLLSSTPAPTPSLLPAAASPSPSSTILNQAQ